MPESFGFLNAAIAPVAEVSKMVVIVVQVV